MKIEGNYAIIETLEEAAVLGCDAAELHIGGVTCRPTRSQVLEAITPKEGDAILVVDYRYRESPTYFYKWGGLRIFDEVWKANALTIGKTVGELRELLDWAKG
jgi:hypothetical protein